METNKSVKASELRIGNLTDMGEVYEIEERRFYVMGDDEISKCSNREKIKPIPITEEWLLRFGFLKDHKKRDVSILDTVMFWKSGIGLTPIIDGKRYRFRNWFDVEIDVPTGVNIDYVHQLQNLYYTLTGKELKIK